MSPRLLNSDEIDRVLPLGEPFFRESGFEGTWNPAHFKSVWEAGIKSGVFFCLVVEKEGKIVAAFGGIVHDDINTGEKVAAETFYYALPEHRGAGLRLFSAFEDEAKRRGAKRIWMVHLESLNPERMDRWYRRRGYKLAERFYLKAL